MEFKYEREQIIDFLPALCRLSVVDPIVVFSEHEIKVQSSIYSLSDDEYVFGNQAGDVQEFFLGNMNGYDYEDATDEEIERLYEEMYYNYDWLEDAFNDCVREANENM